MADRIISNTLLENSAKSFIDEFCAENDADTSMIVAGMVSIIKGNESAFEKMKRQRWFERIWYTISGKNKATIEEMQQKRDLLNKYLVKIISRLSNMTGANSAQAAELSHAVLALDDEFRAMRVSVDKIARALNDKIHSLDTYTFIITDIQNGKYPADKPLLSLIDIMSQLDSKTSKDLNRLRQLKETMVKSGFSFDAKITAREYAEQVFTISEEKVGRMLLFCQNLSERSRFLAYTANLMENYFYLGETDRDVVKNQTDEIIEDALLYSKLSGDFYCVVDKMYADLKNAIPDDFSRLLSMAENCRISACVIGKNSAGKGDLLCILEKEYGDFSVRSVNLEPGRDADNEEKMNAVRNAVQNGEINCIIYCVDVSGGKFEEYERNLIKSLSVSFSSLRIVVALTNCVNKSMGKDLADLICKQTGRRPVCVLAKDFEIAENMTVSAFGVDELVEEIRTL